MLSEFVLNKLYVSIFLAYDPFMPEIYNLFLATVITTWAGESSQVHAINPTVTTTDTMT